MKKVFCTLLASAIYSLLNAQTPIISAGENWKFLDNGSNQGTSWRSQSFSDLTWANGNAQLGYGDGDETTVVSYGPSTSSRYITTYFRKSFSLQNPAIYSDFSLKVKRDDGVVVYVNGTEVYRNNMPTGTISNTTLASSAASDDGATWQTSTLSINNLVSGNNVIAVEIHQNAANSSDLSFDLELIGNPALPATSAVTFVSTGSPWKYLDNGTNQGTSWRSSSFVDNTWNIGNSELGYGDSDEATIVSYGTSTSNRYITTYFRKTISISNPTVFKDFTFKVKRDDGIVIYVNGIEKYRNNMPSGTISNTTLASSAASDDGATWLTFTLPVSDFAFGTNVIAAEVHQNSVSSSDLTFNLELAGNPSNILANLKRGPYLQVGTPTSIILRWRTDVANNSKVNYGTSAGNLTSTVEDLNEVTEHSIKLTGLQPNTKYYYSIGSTTQVLQGDADNFFTTAPEVGTAQKTRIWVTGDCGTGYDIQTKVKNQYHNYIGDNNTDIWMLLGDNAYSTGTDAEYQTKFFDMYDDKMLKQAVLWPTPGNHDYASSADRQDDHNIPYYSIFTVPKNGEAGGVPSGTEAFYSYNYANIHFISLDSYGKEENQYRLYDTLGPQAVWLKQDLAANTQKWTVVYWHHPPYTMCSHNSDTKDELTGIRQNILKILERYKVDLVLCGHSHDYERSKLMKGHFGLEATFDPNVHNLSQSTAKYDGSNSSCPYVKNSSTNYNGTVYVVSGSAGKIDETPYDAWPHNAMYYSDLTYGGSMAIDIEDNRLNAKWVCEDGVIRDQFTIVKDVNKTTNISITPGQSINLKASWVGNYNWSNGSSSRSITVSPTSNTSFSVNDGVSCLSDVFNVNVTVASAIQTTETTNRLEDNLSLQIFPNPIVSKSTIEFSTPFVEEVSLSIHDINGKLIKTLLKDTPDNGTYRYTLDLNEQKLNNGQYFIQLNFGDHSISEKIIVNQ